jgi:hypothetical protein
LKLLAAWLLRPATLMGVAALQDRVKGEKEKGKKEKM